MEQQVYELDGSDGGLKVASAAIRDAQGGARLVLQGVVRAGRLEPPQPAVGERIRRHQRVEQQLLALAAEAREAGVEVELVLPGRAPARTLRREEWALRPAAA